MTPASHRNRRSSIVASTLAIAGAALLAAVAVAAPPSFKLGSARSPSLEKVVVVNGAGRTLYALSPETAHHLLCRSRACTEVWPPLLVHSKHERLADGTGVTGKLALFQRSKTSWQVTLRGKPLYRYSGDSGRAEDNGEGIESFGGIWHAVTAGTASPTTTMTTTTETQPTPQPVPPYQY
jgi:predicted lipoprotein with Yx(FWY)xxD motif